jgi:hypothetical protein
MTTKPRLHEVLAVEQDLKGNAERTRTATLEMFRSKQNRFNGVRRTFRPYSVTEDAVDQGAERLEAETKLATTVATELDKAFRVAAAAITAGYQIDEANTRAKADIEVDGDVVASNVPATFLLQLERRLRDIRSLFREAPCFDPVRAWAVDVDADRRHVLKADPVVTVRKTRTRKYNVMYEATEEHPAQIDVVEIDEPVGEIRSYEWTGMLASSKRAALVARIDALIAAVKQARSRANTVEVETEKRIGDSLRDYLLAPLTQ